MKMAKLKGTTIKSCPSVEDVAPGKIAGSDTTQDFLRSSNYHTDSNDGGSNNGSEDELQETQHSTSAQELLSNMAADVSP